MSQLSRCRVRFRNRYTITLTISSWCIGYFKRDRIVASHFSEQFRKQTNTPVGTYRHGGKVKATTSSTIVTSSILSPQPLTAHWLAANTSAIRWRPRRSHHLCGTSAGSIPIINSEKSLCSSDQIFRSLLDLSNLLIRFFLYSPPNGSPDFALLI